ncbi:MAG: helix-turn-helix domain-containing protein [Bauldia sp.]|nr:helix-turn-helix domain-containing protein [Bauldia sp.]
MHNPMNDFRFRRGSFAEAFEQQDALVGWEQEYQQLGAGRFDGSVESSRLGGVLIQRERFNLSVEQRSVAPKGTINFAWQDSGWRVDGARLGPMVMGIWTGGQEHLSVNAGGADSLLVTVDAALLGARTDDPFITFVPAADSDIAATGEWLRGLLELAGVEAAREESELASLLPRLILDRLASILFRYVDPRPGDRAVPLRVLNDIRAFVDERSGDPLSVGDLSLAFGLSRETLHRSFIDVLGVSPSAWLRVRRLNGAHRDLREVRATGESVSAIAMKWGFWHLGRFSAYYHTHFGRYPSATVQGAH